MKTKHFDIEIAVPKLMPNPDEMYANSGVLYQQQQQDDVKYTDIQLPPLQHPQYADKEVAGFGGQVIFCI